MRKTGYFVYKDWLIWVPLSLAGTWLSYICLNSENTREQVGNLGGRGDLGKVSSRNCSIGRSPSWTWDRLWGLPAVKSTGWSGWQRKQLPQAIPSQLCPWPRAPQQGSVCLIVTFQKCFLYSTLGIPLLKLSPNWHRNTFVCLNIGWLSKDAHFFSLFRDSLKGKEKN